MFYSAFRSVYKNNIIFKLYPCGGDLGRSTDIPNQKTILIYLGIRSAYEPGFIQKFLSYEYLETGAELIHQHRFNAVLIQRGVNSIFQSIGTAH